MAGTPLIDAAFEKGPALTERDLRAAMAELLTLPEDQQRKVYPAFFEAMWLVVSDPDYRGDARMPPE